MKRLLCGWRTALMVCQAMSIAITVVLPAPVASFSARRMSSGLASLLALARCSRKPLPRAYRLGRDLSQPDRSFNRLDLTKERTNAAEVVVPPVLEQPRRFRSHTPVIRVRQVAPLVNLVAKLIDDGRGIVLLLFGREPLSFVKY